MLSLRSFCLQQGPGSVQQASWTAIIISFWGCLRSDNVVPKTAALFDYQRQICLANMEWVSEGVVVRLAKTKTRTSGSLSLKVFLSRLDSLMDLCPVRAIISLLDCTPVSFHGPLLLFHKGGIWTPLLYRDLRAVIRAWAASVDVDPSSFGSHSARSGSATVAHKAGVQDSSIMKLGDWLSNAFLSYIKQDVTELRNIQLQMLHQLSAQVDS